jgi:hypothetical protein
MLLWQHRSGIRYGGRCATLFSAPRQSETISMLPERSLCSLFMLSRIKWMAMRPRSSPLYAFATSSSSENVPLMRPCLLEHFRMKAAKQQLGYISRMYDPSVPATSKPSAMESCSQASPPITLRCSHSHVFPHKQRTPRKDEGARLTVASGLEDVRCQHSPPRVDSTKQMVLRWLLGWMCEWWNLFGFLPDTNTSSVAPSALR